MTPVENCKCESASKILEPAIECVVAIIRDVSECLQAASDLAGPHLSQLSRLRNRLAFEPSLQALTDARQSVHSELSAVAALARTAREITEQELQQVLGLLAQSTQTLTLRRDANADHFSRLSGSLEQIERGENSPDLAATLRQELDTLRHFVEAAHEENERSLSGLRRQIEAYRAHLRQGTNLETLDPFTGLPKACAIEPQLQNRLGAGRCFSVLNFKIEDHAAIRERFGQTCLIEIIKLVGTALVCQVRAHDFVCHWGEAGFVVLFDCNFSTAGIRASQIARWLSGAYTVECEGTASVVAVELSVDVAPPEPHDTVQTILARLE